MVLELARLRTVDRPVRGVVDARGVLVRKQPTGHLEQLHGEHADVAERVEKRGADLLRFALRSVRGGRTGHAQDAVEVDVLADGPKTHLSVPRPNADDRQLALEVDDRLRELAVSKGSGASTRRWPFPS